MERLCFACKKEFPPLFIAYCESRMQATKSAMVVQRFYKLRFAKPPIKPNSVYNWGSVRACNLLSRFELAGLYGCLIPFERPERVTKNDAHENQFL